MIAFYKVKKFCCEDISLIENYEQALNDQTQIWDCHHRKETDEGLSRAELIELGLYFNRPASELIFLTHVEHTSLHHKGKQSSTETRSKMSVAQKGKPKTVEHRSKIVAILHQKCICLTPDYETRIMDRSMLFRWHPDWIIVETVDV